MNSSTVKIILVIIHMLFFIYALFALGSYTILAIISAVETKEYMKKNSFCELQRNIVFNHFLPQFLL